MQKWIYSFQDYCQVFDLQTSDLQKSILDYPGGISGFNAEMHKRGQRVVSADSIYSYDSAHMQEYTQETLLKYELYLQNHPEILENSDANKLKEIKDNWKKTTDLFLQDYPQGKAEGRYQAAKLEHLPFKPQQFQLALCSDLLFLTQDQHGYTPEKLIEELCRVANEIRVFPLLDEKAALNPHLGPVLNLLQKKNFGIEIRQIAYKKLKGNNAMMRIWAKECLVAHL